MLLEKVRNGDWVSFGGKLGFTELGTELVGASGSSLRVTIGEPSGAKV